MIKAPVSDSGQPLGKSGAAAPSADEPNSQRAEPQATAPRAGVVPSSHAIRETAYER